MACSNRKEIQMLNWFKVKPSFATIVNFRTSTVFIGFSSY